MSILRAPKQLFYVDTNGNFCYNVKANKVLSMLRTWSSTQKSTPISLKTKADGLFPSAFLYTLKNSRILLKGLLRIMTANSAANPIPNTASNTDLLHPQNFNT